MHETIETIHNKVLLKFNHLLEAIHLLHNDDVKVPTVDKVTATLAYNTAS